MKNEYFDNEIWKDVIGYEGLYKISTLGNMYSVNFKRSKKGGILKTNIGKRGYKVSFLMKDKKRSTQTVHRLVAQAFIPNPENKPCVNHKNGIKTDNRVENLEWVTYSENNLHSFRILKKKPTICIGSKNAASKKCIQIDYYGNIINQFESHREAYKITGICLSSIEKCIKGTRNHAGGFIWKNI